MNCEKAKESPPAKDSGNAWRIKHFFVRQKGRLLKFGFLRWFKSGSLTVLVWMDELRQGRFDDVAIRPDRVQPLLRQFITDESSEVIRTDQ